MKFRALLMAFALAGSVACGGGETKADAMPTEEAAAPAEAAPAEVAPAEEAPADEAAPMEDGSAEPSADGEESGE